MGYRRGTPLRDRPVVPPPGTAPEPGAGPPPVGPALQARQPTRRHCWVRGPDGAPGPHPGLLLEWRRTPHGEWEALVAYAVQEGGSVTLVQQWLPASLVAPLRSGRDS
jgi:hypothetical protein